MTDERRNAGATFALLLTAAIWGSAFVFQKFAADELSASFIVAARFSAAGVITALATIKKWHRIDRGYLLGGLATGITMSLGTWLQTAAMTFGTSPGKSAFLTAAYCVIVPFLYWLVRGEKPRANHLLSAVICLVGIGLISLNGEGGVTFGDGITLVCSVVFAANIVSISIFCEGRDPMLLTMLQICVAALCGWVGILIFGGMPEHISMGAAGNVLYLALFSTALCLSLQSIGLKYTNPTVGTILLSLESVFGVLFSILLYGETVTLRMAVGFAVVFAAVLLAQFRFEKK
ncbi:MAG: DMT family transporter [Anaerotignum sp.]|jgi:drug/metabolite transporter (DMT)-like permease|nr:DMT family transporter [Anaerotignum sp.]